MSKVTDVEEFDSDNGKEEETPEEEEVVEEEEEEEQEEEGGEEKEKKPTDPPPAPAPEKLYYFNGRQLTADQLFEESNKIHGEYTRLTQQKPKEEEKVEYDAKQIEEFKKFAKQVGIVFKEELTEKEQKNEEKRILQGFIDKHPEYKDQNKQRELFVGLAQYNTALPYLERSLEKAHTDLTPPPSPSGDRAAQTKLSRSSISTPGSKVNKSQKYTDEQVNVMKQMGVWDE